MLVKLFIAVLMLYKTEVLVLGEHHILGGHRCAWASLWLEHVPSIGHAIGPRHSTDSEITSPFCSNSNPYPPSSSSILSGLLSQEDGSILPNSSFQPFSCGSGVSFPHPPAQFVEDLSV